MTRLTQIARALIAQPRYTLMRGVARFAVVRRAVRASRSSLQARRLRRFLAACESRMTESLFQDIDREDVVRRLRSDGVAFGLRLPKHVTEELTAYAERTPCFADRDSRHGFRVRDFDAAQRALGKPLLLAQYFNATEDCAAVRRLRDDPALQWIAGRFLGSMPAFVGANLWWTFPVRALAADRDRHAHLFHRDVDDFAFFKFFFYLTDVLPGDGAHVCVVASHAGSPMGRAAERWKLRRYSDAEIGDAYAADRILEISGPAGTGFAENTLCVHKGLTPTRQPRLLLQLQFALFDYGVMHDRRSPASLRMLA